MHLVLHSSTRALVTTHMPKVGIYCESVYANDNDTCSQHA